MQDAESRRQFQFELGSSSSQYNHQVQSKMNQAFPSLIKIRAVNFFMPTANADSKKSDSSQLPGTDDRVKLQIRLLKSTSRQLPNRLELPFSMANSQLPTTTSVMKTHKNSFNCQWLFTSPIYQNTIGFQDKSFTC